MELSTGARVGNLAVVSVELARGVAMGEGDGVDACTRVGGIMVTVEMSGVRSRTPDSDSRRETGWC